MKLLTKIKNTFWDSYYKAKAEDVAKPKFSINGNGVMTMKASDLVNSKAWEDELNNRISIEPTKRGHSMNERSEDYVEEVEYFYGS